MITMPTMSISMAKGLKKSPVWNTVVQKNAANRGNSAISLQPFPTWKFEFDMDFIEGNESQASSVIAQFLGVMMAVRGRTSLFLFQDPQDNTVALTGSAMLDVTPGTVNPMGNTGNGTSTKFQLARTMGDIAGAYDIIQNLGSPVVVKVNGTTKSTPGDYSIDSLGVITFTSAPSAAATLTWSGPFQYACRFDEDTVDMIRVFTTNSGTDQFTVSSIAFSSEFV